MRLTTQVTNSTVEANISSLTHLESKVLAKITTNEVGDIAETSDQTNKILLNVYCEVFKLHFTKKHNNLLLSDQIMSFRFSGEGLLRSFT